MLADARDAAEAVGNQIGLSGQFEIGDLRAACEAEGVSLHLLDDS